jgi:hypothetical protein
MLVVVSRQTQTSLDRERLRLDESDKKTHTGVQEKESHNQGNRSIATYTRFKKKESPQITEILSSNPRAKHLNKGYN